MHKPNDPEKDEHSPNYFAIIPAEVRYDNTLTMGARLLYGEISALTKKEGYCWASNNYFADLYSKSKTTISKWISELEKRGHITSELIYKEGSKEIEGRYITIRQYPIQENLKRVIKKSSIPYPRKLKEPTQENCKDNSTVNNTSNNTINSTSFNVEQQSCPTSSDDKSDSSSIKNPKKEKPLPAAKFYDEVFEIIEYLNDAVGRNFDPAAQHSKHVRGRLKEGATVQEMKEVIDFKAREWIDDEKMKEYLRPQTLFNKTKYSEYRDQFSRLGEKFKAMEELKQVVDDFAEKNRLIIIWDHYEMKALEEIAVKLRSKMKDSGDELTMENLKLVLGQVLGKLDDYMKENFSMKLINSRLNSILNAKSNINRLEAFAEFLSTKKN